MLRKLWLSAVVVCVMAVANSQVAKAGEGCTVSWWFFCTGEGCPSSQSCGFHYVTNPQTGEYYKVCNCG